MRVLDRGRFFVSALIAIAGLTACGGSRSTASIPSAPSPVQAVLTSRSQHSRTSSYQVLYRFKSQSHGARPVSSLIDVNGTLYGTTFHGGASGNGTVFSLSSTGKEKVLHAFGGGADGAWPLGNLLDVNGTLYGTTSKGGGSGCNGAGCGTVYSITTSGSESVLYRFTGGSDGADPWSGLINVNGLLYGTTAEGGPYYSGTVYSVTPSGSESVLYRFHGGYDGEYPEASLVDVDGTLYGTTYNGGRGSCFQGEHCGTVFSVTTAGVETVLHSFRGPDGAFPLSSLVEVKGILYGTTEDGGTACGGYGCGIVFSVTTAGAVKDVLIFGKDNAGSNPEAGVIAVKGKLYGTTLNGGSSDLGTVFSVSTAGIANSLHSFSNSPDGRNPQAALVSSKGVLYGTTPSGGTSCGANGCGTVFALSL